MGNIFLFDIDGTLLSTGRSGQTAMEHTLQQMFGIAKLDYEIPTAGRTDRAIISDLFAWHEVEMTEEKFREFRDCYFSVLPDHLEHNDGMILPGVIDVLQALTANGNEATGLLTGNFETSGWMKVTHYGLHDHFSFGAFGDDDVNRDDVARKAREVVQRIVGSERSGSQSDPQLWVIGDTPADVQCARAIDAKVLAVATGRYSVQELKAAEPNFLCETLQDTETVLNVLHS